MSTVNPPAAHTSGPSPAWAVAELFPAQGSWREEDYLGLTRDTRRLVELTDGSIEVLPMPTTSHQLILQFLFDALRAFVNPQELGIVCFAGIRVRLRAGMLRQPDLVYMAREHFDRIGEEYWDGADIAFEIVSRDAGSRDRDYRLKRENYAEGHVPEYWIIDPELRRVTVLVLQGNRYQVGGEYSPGDQAVSSLLTGFSLDVAALFDAADFKKS